MRKSFWLGLGLGLIGLLLFMQHHYRLALCMGNSMWPTLPDNHLLLVDKLAYRDTEPQRGDIVVARYHQEMVVKRVVGLPGEVVEVKRGLLYLNHQRVQATHALNPGDLEIAPGRMAPGKYALLGDNRSLSIGQPVHAIVSKDQVVGKIVFCLPF